jgi:hypothetical protein
LEFTAILADSTFNSIFIHDLSPVGWGTQRLAGRSVDRLKFASADKVEFLAAREIPRRLYAASAC